MINRNKSFNKQRQCYQTLVVTALLTGSLFQFIAPALADGTTAGTSISNTATATYEDPNAPGSPINSTSNTVTVTVAEVAGITVTGSGIANQTTPGGSTQSGNVLVYTYTLTNVGNDPTKFQIPNLATTTGPATVSGILPPDKNGVTPPTGNLQYSTDGGATWTNIPAGGLTTGAIAVNGTVLVRVPVTVQAGAQTGDIITARLGQTPGDAQNQPRAADGGDVYTVQISTAGPINGVREASATQQTQVGNTAKSKALATILKTKTAYDNAGTSASLTDDLLTYGLSLRVESNDVTNSGLTPAALAGKTITLDSVAHILVSDAIPANTVLNSTPIAPSGWKVVYTTDDPATINADVATWSYTAPALNTVKRVGFVNDPTIVTSVSTGTTVSGFSIQVKTTGASASPVTIYNIAQVAGTTAGDTTATNKIYDNSGDQNPDNYNGTTFPTTPDGGFVPNNTTPTNVDTQNNNTGPNSTTGDVNATTLTAPAPTSVLNGPNGVPDAVGPTDNGDDFTNKSALISPNTAPGVGVDPAAVSFTNTVQNTGTSVTNISLVPTPPTIKADLPTNTVVTVSYQGLSAAYKYDGTNFIFQTGSGLVGGSAISATNPVRIDAVAANGGKANYGVSVDLPANTPLSTDTTAQGAAITTIQRGFPTPVTAYIESAATPTGIPGTNPLNISIDRVYTGFLQLLKESRVLQGTGPALPIIADGTFSVTPKKPAPGNIIEYRITYKNISTPQVGTGNLILNADKIVITEDGTTAANGGNNNWALDNDTNSQIDTSNIVSSAKDSGTSTITFFTGNPATNPGSDQTGTTANTDVSKYVDAVTGQVAPGIQRTFSFQRKVN
ncbi:beta strand repeat-containing protein [Nostoc sp.]|uniref:beta strand repeat-containing protein n=1 Tax=Nostoc sp. TaxID=1180 RepID=UPI002FFC1293